MNIINIFKFKKFFFLKIFISLFFLIYVFKNIRLIDLFELLNEFDLKIFIFSYFIFLLSDLMISFRLNTLIETKNATISLSNSFRHTIISRMYYFFLPLGINNIVIRYQYLKKELKKKIILQIIIIEKLLFFSFSILFIIFFISFSDFNSFSKKIVLNFVIDKKNILLFFCVLFFLSILFISNLKKNLFNNNFILQLLNYKSLIISFIIQFLLVYRIFLLFKSINVDFSFFNQISDLSIINLFQILPIAYGGIGWRDFVFVYFLNLNNYSMGVAIIISYMILIQLLISGLFGLILFLKK